MTLQMEKPTLKQVRQHTTLPTVEEVIDGLERWETDHKPFDRTSHLNLFQYIIEPGTGGALVPLSNNLAETKTKLPAIYLKPNAVNQYLSRLRYPLHLYQEMPPMFNLLALNWRAQNINYEREIMLRIQDDNQARALMTSAYTPIDTLELLKIAEPYLKGGRVRWFYDDELTFNLSISFPQYSDEIKVGQVIERGIHIRNSEVGLASVTMAGYIFQLACLNGNISTGGGDSFRFRHVGDPERLRDKIVAAVESSKLEVERVVAQFKNAVNVKIEEPFKMMEALTKDKELTQEQFKTMMDSFMTLKDDKDNLWGVSQAISNAAGKFDGETAYQLQRLAVDVTNRAI